MSEWVYIYISFVAHISYHPIGNSGHNTSWTFLDTTLAKHYAKSAPNSMKYGLAILSSSYLQTSIRVRTCREEDLSSKPRRIQLRAVIQTDSHLAKVTPDKQIRLLSLVSQRDAFSVGDMDVVAFGFDSKDIERTSSFSWTESRGFWVWGLHYTADGEISWSGKGGKSWGVCLSMQT